MDYRLGSKIMFSADPGEASSLSQVTDPFSQIQQKSFLVSHFLYNDFNLFFLQSGWARPIKHWRKLSRGNI